MQTTAAEILQVFKQAGIRPQVMDQLKPDVPLALQGLVSIDLPTIAAAAEQHFKIDLSDADAHKLRTVHDYVRFVNQKLK